MSEQVMECRFALHLPNTTGARDDLHLIKEWHHHPDGTVTPNIRMIKNFQRTYYTTTKANQNHVEKKEYELRTRLKEHHCIQSELAWSVARSLRLPSNGPNSSLSKLSRSPYLYGTDVSSTSIIKHRYMSKWENVFSKAQVACLDFETDMSTEEELPIMGILSMKNHAHLTILKSKIRHIPNFKERFWNACTKMETSDGKTVKEHLIERGLWMNVNLDIVDNELAVVTNLLESSHKWSPDFISIWNMDFDVSKMMQTFKAFDVDPVNYMSDPRVPPEYRHATYIPGQAYKKKANGTQTPVPPIDRWNQLYVSAGWQTVCAMCAFKKLRPTEPKLPDYSLDTAAKVKLSTTYEENYYRSYMGTYDEDFGILDINAYSSVSDYMDAMEAIQSEYDKEVDEGGTITVKMKNDLGKLKFPPADGYSKRDWHVYMQKHHIVEYAVYCLWDGIVLEKLDEATNDLSTTLPVLCGVTDLPRFPSGPKKLCDNMHFFVQELGYVVGSTSNDMTTDFCKHVQGLNDWITLLEPHNVHSDIGIPAMKDLPDVRTNASVAAFDVDVKSAYPNTGDAENCSKETTEKELCYMEGYNRMEMRDAGLNYSAAKVNSVELCRKLYKAPSLTEVLMTLSQQGKITLNNPELI